MSPKQQFFLELLARLQVYAALFLGHVHLYLHHKRKMNHVGQIPSTKPGASTNG